MDGYGSGWSGPGAKTSGMNAAEQQSYKDLKQKLETEELQKRERENEERVARGEKPLKDGIGSKIKKQFKRMMM